jgi:hypothetical protein
MAPKEKGKSKCASFKQQSEIFRFGERQDAFNGSWVALRET